MMTPLRGPHPAQRSAPVTPRALLVSNSRKVGGGAVSLFTLASGLREQGETPIVVHPDDGPVFDKFETAGFASVVVPDRQPSWTRPWTTCRSTREWSGLFDEHAVDVVHANACEAARTVSLACWRRSVPLVCHVRFPVSAEYADWAFRRLPSPDAFVFCSRALRDEVAPLLLRRSPRAAVRVVHNAVCTETFAPRERCESSTNPRLRVGILAHLVPVKGHGDFLRMAALLVDRGVDAEFLLIGSEPEPTHAAALRALVDRLSLAEHVRFLGERNDIPRLLNELDVLVCSSHVETFGRCLIEAMSCEVPVVATDVGGIPEVVDDGVTGLLVPPHAPDELARAVDALRDSDTRRRMGRAGRERVLTNFSRSTHTERVLAIYENLLEGNQ